MISNNPLQAFIEGMSVAWQQQRSKTQMTLGKLIEAFEVLPSDCQIVGLGDLMSYRGYYCDLAFEPSDKPEAVAVILAQCKHALGQEFTGYKGGEFRMNADTPLWVAPYGSSGKRLMAIVVGTDPLTVITAPEDQ